jgi:CRP-like cAMP-binding protein
VRLQNEMLAALSPSDLGRLHPYLVTFSAPSGRTLFRAGDLVEHVYFPSSAVLSVVTPMADGREVESQTVGRESGVGLAGAMSGLPAANRVFAQVAGEVIRIPAMILRRQARESGTLMDAILRHMDLANSQSEQAAACNALHDAQSRLAKWLLMTQDRVRGDVLPLTQEYLAAMLGIQRTSVSMIAATMKADTVIKYTRGRICISDREKLEDLACECYAASQARLAEVGAYNEVRRGASVAEFTDPQTTAMGPN